MQLTEHIPENEISNYIIFSNVRLNAALRTSKSTMKTFLSENDMKDAWIRKNATKQERSSPLIV